MFTSDLKDRRDWIADAAIILLLIVSSRVAFEPIAEPFLLGVFGVTLGAWAVRGMHMAPVMLVYLAAMSVWVGGHALVSDYINWTTVLGHFVRILVGFFVLGIVSDPLERMASWIVNFTAAGMIVYGFGQISPPVFETLYNFTPEIMRLSGGDSNQTVAGGWPRANWLFVTFSSERPGQFHGFMWEPAAAGMIMSLALWLRMLAGHRTFDRGNVILMAGVLATLSTTSILALAITVTFTSLRHGRFGLLALYFVLPAFLVVFSQSDYLLEKIVSEFKAGYSGSMQWSLSRFASYILDMRDFSLAPFFGNGIVVETHASAGLRLPSNNGISDYLNRYGIYMSLLAFVIYSVGMIRYYRHRKVMLLGMTAVLVVFAWAEKFFELPFFYTLSFAGYCSWSFAKDAPLTERNAELENSERALSSQRALGGREPRFHGSGRS